MLILILGLAIFLGVHSVKIAAPEWAARQKDQTGPGLWRAIYSIVSLLGFLMILWGYGQARQLGVVLYTPPIWTQHLAAFLMLFAFIALGVYAAPAGRLKPLLKHPMLLAGKIWAVAHLLANGDLASLVLFLAFLAWAVADRISVKRRRIAVPASGPASNDAIAVAIGFLLYILFVWKLHEWLIGVRPLG